MLKKAPIRTCLGCGLRFPQAELVRFCLDTQGVPTLDLAGVLPGRGVYCCRTKSCGRSFFGNKKRLARAFKGDSAVGVLIDQLKIEKMLESGSFR